MALKLISVKCPDCGQTLSIEANRAQAFCTYCGAKILISNENEFIVRNIDEASIQKAENDRIIRLKELELQEKRDAHYRNLRKVLTVIWLFISIVLLFIIISKMSVTGSSFGSGFLILFYIAGPIIGGGAYLIFKWLPEKENEKRIESQGGIRFPNGLTPFSDKKYQTIVESLRAAGFTNISCINLQDLNILTALVNTDKVEKVTVNGAPITTGGKIYLPDASIVISYHGR